MHPIDNFLLIGCEPAATLPTLVEVCCGATNAYPCSFRVLLRQPDEDGAALWSRTREAVAEMAARHDPAVQVPNGHVLALHSTQTAYVALHGSVEGRNHRASLRWLMSDHMPADTRVWAATKLARMLGMLPALSADDVWVK